MSADHPVRRVAVDVAAAAQLFSGPGETRALSRSLDWAATSLGPVGAWSSELRAAVRTVLPSSVPMLLWWGQELAQIYNDAYTPVLGDKHPAALGQPAAESWREVWDQLGPLADSVMRGEGATYSENQLLLLHRHGYVEETYWTFSYSPVYGETGSAHGIFVATNEVTSRVLGDRRLRTLHELGGVSSAEGETAAGACRSAIEVLRQSRVDVPFALAYLFEANARCGRLLASYGVRTGTAIAPEALPTHDNGGPAWSVARSGRGELVAGLRRNHADDFEPGPIGAAIPDSAMVLPLTRSGQTSLAGLLVLAVSPYRAFDDEYRVFFDLVAGQVSTALTDAIAYQMERRRAEQLVELDVARSRFFQNISHEFQTPLTLLLEPLRALLAEPELQLSGGHRAAMQAARRAALRLQRLVDTLLDTARADANRLHTQQEPTDLALLTAELASMFRSVAEHAGLRLVVHTPTLPEPVPVDREMWAKIVLNLLSNAVKFTRAGYVSVALCARDEYVELSVSDSGIGIPATELPRVFDRFHQLSGASARSSEGSGIGLSLVSELVSALHGEVLVESILGEGSTFTVRLPRGGATADVAPRPLEPVENTATPFVEEALRWVPAGGAEEPRQRADGLRSTARVLLVEDNADMREYLTRLLREQSWTVDTAGDGDTALESAMAQPPDLVLSDIMLPGLDGIGLLQAMRGDQSLSRVPVILLTARAGSEATVEGLRSGADDYVAKPFEPNELLARIRVHLELSLLRELLISSGEQRVANLEAALSTRGVISQAVGILMAQRHCDAETAFELLNKASQNSNVKVHDVASRIVARASR